MNHELSDFFIQFLEEHAIYISKNRRLVQWFDLKSQEEDSKFNQNVTFGKRRFKRTLRYAV